MKTAVTTITTEQTGMDHYKDLHHTKVFDDSATLGEIKQWIKSKYPKSQFKVEDTSLECVTFSDVEE